MDVFTTVHIAKTALSIALSAWESGCTLSRFSNDGNVVDDTTRAFANEIKALSSACDGVSKLLTDVADQISREESPNIDSDLARLSQCAENQLTGCQTVIDELKNAVCYATCNFDLNKGPEFVSQVVHHLQLKMNATSDVRNCIQSHTASLQTILQAVEIENSYIVPSHADEHLKTHLVKLSANRHKLEALRSKRTDEQYQSTNNEDFILQVTEKILWSGKTLYATRIRGLSILEEPTSVSQGQVQDWIRHTNTLEEIPSEHSVNETCASSLYSHHRTERTSSDVDAPSNTSHTLLETEGISDTNENDEELELDALDEFNIETAQAAIREGRSFFRARDYQNADSTLQEALKIMSEISTGYQEWCDYAELRYMLAVCAFHLHEPTTAEGALLSIVKNPLDAESQDNTERQRLSEAGYLLAIISLRLGKIEQARIHCDSSMKARRRLFGKTHESSYESLALMSHILEIQGNPSRSRIVATLIPEEQRPSLIREISDLSRRGRSEDSGERSMTASQLEIPRPVTASSTCSPEPIERPSGDLSGTQDDRMSPLPEVVHPGASATRLHVLARAVRSKPPASADLRKEWLAFFGYPKVEGDLCQALLDARADDALRLSKLRGATKLSSWLQRHEMPRNEYNHLTWRHFKPDAFRLAALFGDSEVVQDLIARKSAVMRGDGLTALHCAALGGYTEIAESIIAAGANINACSRTCGTPLDVAVLAEHIDVVNLLLRHGAKVEETSVRYRWRSAIHAACMTGNLSIVKALGIDSINTIAAHSILNLNNMWTLRRFLMANRQGKPNPLHKLIYGYSGFEAPSSGNGASIHWQPLAVASYFGHESIVRFLLSQGADMDSACGVDKGASQSIYSHSTLSLATLGGSTVIVEALLERRATAQKPLLDPTDPLMVAVYNGHEDCAVLLMDYGAKIPSKVFQDAAKVGMERVIKKAQIKQGLPARWEQIILPSGERYYFDHMLKTKSWEKPESFDFEQQHQDVIPKRGRINADGSYYAYASSH